MKNLFQFLSEAGTSQASAQAAKLNLRSDGHGSWFDSRGKLVAKTEGGKLIFVDKKKKEVEGPVQQMAQRRADDDLAGAPLQKKEDPKRVKSKKDEGDGKEGDGNTLTTAFGRFNPPTTGHQKLLKFAEKIAAGGDVKIYPSRTQDNKKNPLDPDMKISYMKKMFPDFEEQIINDAEMKTIFDVLTTANADGYTNVNIVVGADRLSEFQNLAHKYNGDLYDFEEIKVISAGERDDDPDDVSGMKSSKLRQAVIDDDLEAFKKGMPEDFAAGDIQALYDATRTGMKLKKKAAIKSVKDETKIDTSAKNLKVTEGYKLWEIAPKLDPKGLREQYVNEKIFNMGDVVESLNTGLVGRIIRRGANHLICVTQENFMFKSWIRDVMEAVKPASKTGKYGVPAKDREVGTDKYLKYAQSMVPGQGKIRNFNIREFINKYKKK